jgi:hypothetical protein
MARYIFQSVVEQVAQQDFDWHCGMFRQSGKRAVLGHTSLYRRDAFQRFGQKVQIVGIRHGVLADFRAQLIDNAFDGYMPGGGVALEIVMEAAADNGGRP